MDPPLARTAAQCQPGGGIGGFLSEDQFVDVEHRVARPVLSNREGGLRRLHDLARLDLAGRDDAGNARPQNRIG